MSAIDVKFLSRKESAFSSGSNKKIKRKRHRNKCKNSGLKKKRLKKLYLLNNTASYKPNIVKISPYIESIMSNWYWSNYKKAVEWQNKHKMAHWRACALALYEENRYLLQIINSMQPGFVPEVPVTQICQNLKSGGKCSKKNTKSKYQKNFSNIQTSSHQYKRNWDDDGEIEDDDCNKEVNDDVEFEMSEEMMEFFTQSYKQKMDLKKFEEKELKDSTEQEVKQIQNNKLKRSTEMSFLYGEGASMITGMETAVQLTFEKYCDTKSPKYWPNIPFRL